MTKETKQNQKKNIQLIHFCFYNVPLTIQAIITKIFRYGGTTDKRHHNIHTYEATCYVIRLSVLLIQYKFGNFFFINHPVRSLKKGLVTKRQQKIYTDHSVPKNPINVTRLKT